jgi:hypothetical protein
MFTVLYLSTGAQFATPADLYNKIEDDSDTAKVLDEAVTLLLCSSR